MLNVDYYLVRISNFQKKKKAFVKQTNYLFTFRTHGLPQKPFLFIFILVSQSHPLMIIKKKFWPFAKKIDRRN